MNGPRRTGVGCAIGQTALLLVALTIASPAAGQANLGERVRNAAEVYRELLHEPDRGVPTALLQQCRCVAVIPHVVKGAIGYGARYGRGVISCRDSTGGWSPISFVTLTGGSLGLQIGGESSDVVLFFMTERGARSLISSKFTLGGKASVAAGPAGRSAEASTDVKLNAEIYSYAKAKGLFAGVSLEGARLAPDEKANGQYYGAPVTARTLLFGLSTVELPPEAREFLNALPH
jgi:lipid-binding SYLF domain-containing protein